MIFKVLAQLIALCLFSSIALSAPAKFCIRLSTSVDAFSTGIKSATCQVHQVLKWEENTSLWKCKFNGSREAVAKRTLPKSIGYSYEGQNAFVIYEISPRSDLGRFLLKGMQFEDITAGALMQIDFRSKPQTNDSSLILSSPRDHTELNVTDLKYAPCL